ncbi:MAG: DAK2 domain-containing protein [Bacillota bacterium]
MNSATKSEYGHSLHASDFKKMILGANYFFDREKETINSLNVFPVPDGDTGTNMSMTLKAAVEGSMAYEGQSIGELSEIVASKALMGARGNSGVILSQILRGIAHGLRKKEYITPGELSKAFQYGVVYAYRAVSRPVEGTILTVAREMARGIRSAVRKGENLYDSMEEAIRSGKKALDKTTDMLPVLKEAGVVDAGGLGLLVFFEGCLYALKRSLNEIIPHKNLEQSAVAAGGIGTMANLTEPFNLDYPYCTEMIIKSNQGIFTGLEAKLSSLGDSLLVVTDNHIAKIHIHAASPDLVIKTALEYGTLHDIKIENMLDQHNEAFQTSVPLEKAVLLPGPEKQEKGEAGIISVSFGEGFREIFLSLGADEIVFGGQTMNPNVEDLLNAVENLPQQSAIILPNNKNIILVAEQVENLTVKKVAVLKSKTLPEGLAALLAYNPTERVDENVSAMDQAIKKVKTGLITYATRDTIIKSIKVKQGQFLGLSGDKILTANQKLNQAALSLAKEIVADNNDIITIFYGQNVSQKNAFTLAAIIEKEYPKLEVELQYGGQPIYYYIFSVE